jgi:hypothetical protein
VVDAEIRALIEQAGRNLEALERLAQQLPCGIEQATVSSFRTRLLELHAVYQRETNALTLAVLQQAVERRSTADRRRAPDRRGLPSA